MMLVNGAAVESIPASDRGLAYGDGVFRTLRAVNDNPLHWHRHYAKLKQDCVSLAIPCPDEAPLLAEARAASIASPQAALKIIVTRGSGKRGYALPDSPMPLRVVISSPQQENLDRRAGIRIHLCRLRLAHQPALAGIKHLNRLENVLARAEWNEADISEGLLLDHEGDAIGGTMSNLFIVENGTLFTPDLSRCGVAGVTRSRVIEIAEKAGIVCRIEKLPLQRVLDADELFLVNSLIGLWPVVSMESHQWRIGQLGSELLRSLEAEDAALA